MYIAVELYFRKQISHSTLLKTEFKKNNDLESMYILKVVKPNPSTVVLVVKLKVSTPDCLRKIATLERFSFISPFKNCFFLNRF